MRVELSLWLAALAALAATMDRMHLNMIMAKCGCFE